MRILLSAVSVLLLSSICLAQDAAGSKDHPLFNRMPGYRIARYVEHDFDVLEKFKNKDKKYVPVEGHYYYFNYLLIKGSKPASGVQVLRNYKNAVVKAGGNVVLEDGCCDIYLKLEKNKRITWVHVQAYSDARSYQVWIVEEAEMKQDIFVDAASMMGEINTQGRVALYGIYFDFDKSEVKPESDPTLKEISKLLSENPELKLYVVGHTDSVGDFDYNMKLSQSRASAVVEDLISKYGVGKNRLTAYGVGCLCPVESNDTEEGKSRNRRVELIKQ